MFEILRDEVFPFMKSLGDGTAGSSYTAHMKDAIFMMPSPRVLAAVQVERLKTRDGDDAVRHYSSVPSSKRSSPLFRRRR